MRTNIAREPSLTKGEKTRRRILECVTELYYKNGLSGMSLGKVTETLGLSQPAIYTHFRNMDEIILQACRHWVTEAKTIIDRRSDMLATSRSQIDAVIEQNIRYSANNLDKEAMLLLLFYQSLTSVEAHSLYSAIMENGMARLQIIIQRGIQDGSWKVKDSKATAADIHSLLLGEIMKLILSKSKRGAGPAIERMKIAVHSLLGLHHMDRSE